MSQLYARVEDHPDFSVFHGILSRCHCPTNLPIYTRYGGRGITVCDRWREGGFRVFNADMGDRPSPKHFIDRIDNNKGYSPENCRWATPKEQGNNRRTNKLITHDGVTLTMSQWAERAGINYRTLKGRIRSGWPIARALSPKLYALSDSVIVEVLAARKAGMGVCAIARKFGISPASASEICSGKRVPRALVAVCRERADLPPLETP